MAYALPDSWSVNDRGWKLSAHPCELLHFSGIFKLRIEPSDSLRDRTMDRDTGRTQLGTKHGFCEGPLYRCFVDRGWSRAGAEPGDWAFALQGSRIVRVDTFPGLEAV